MGFSLEWQEGPASNVPSGLSAVYLLGNRGEPVTDVQIYVDEASRPMVTIDPAASHMYLETMETGEWEPIVSTCL